MNASAAKGHVKPDTKGWLSAARWKLIQASVPVTCVDVLLVRMSRVAPDTVAALGLILREVPQDGQKWCLIGGRLLHGEALQHAILRQVHETVGNQVKLALRQDQQPLYIAQYGPFRVKPFGLDPRQHAVALTYAVRVSGDIRPQGEAIDFRWFDVRKLPAPAQIGFDQTKLLKTCLKLLQSFR